MTTIVYRDGVLCADSAVFDRGTYCGSTEKIFLRDDGAAIGICGSLGEMLRFAKWFTDGEAGDRPSFDESNSEAIVIRPDGSIWWYGKDDHAEIIASSAAIGTGFQVAMGAMAAGASAERAMEIAADLDMMTRRPLHVLKLRETA